MFLWVHGICITVWSPLPKRASFASWTPNALGRLLPLLQWQGGWRNQEFTLRKCESILVNGDFSVAHAWYYLVSRWAPKRARERARVSQTDSEWAKMCESEPKREPEWVRESKLWCIREDINGEKNVFFRALPESHKGRGQLKKKNVFFGALPELPNPPLAPIWATWSFFFWKSKFKIWKSV